MGDGLDRVGPCACDVVIGWQLLLVRCALEEKARKVGDVPFCGSAVEERVDHASRDGRWVS